jgi:tetratricopeptide (TPR) repeat protein
MKNMLFKPCIAPTLDLRRFLQKTAVLSSLLAALFANSAIADEIADVSKLLRGGQYAEALVKTDSFLGQHPRDAQMRFLKGVILTEQNKPSDAIAIFTKLTEDFPDLPEPYNNLAVLYAAGGQFEKARSALDKAIRTNPTYATAYENLGDIHAKLARQAYDKALQLDSGNSGAKSKLTLVRSLVAGTATGSSSKVAAAPTAPAAIKPATPAPVVVASANPKPAPAPAASAPAAPASPKAAAPMTIAKVEPVKIDRKPVQKPAPEGNPDRDAVLSSVTGWAKAWSARDVKAYLGYYGSDFETPNGVSRKAWIEERHARIAGKGSINVKVEAPQVTVNGNTATVKFRQTYVSDRLTANSRKTLTLTKNGGKWQIRQERTGS